MAADSGRSVPVAVRFTALACIWGSSFVLVKQGLERFSPLQLSTLRMVSGTALLLVVLLVSGQRLPRTRAVWLHVAVVALLMNSIPFTLVAVGEQRVDSVLAGIWNATTPLMTLAVILLLFPDERPTRERLAGLVLGFVGVVVVLGPWHGVGPSELLGQAALAGMALCYGLGTPYMRRNLSDTGQPLVVLATAQVLCGSAQLLVLSPVAGLPPVALDGPTLAVVVLGAAGTGWAYVLFYGLVRDMGSTNAAGVTYLTVVVAIVLGVVLLGESIGFHEPAGAAIVLLGVALSNGRLTRRRPSLDPTRAERRGDDVAEAGRR